MEMDIKNFMELFEGNSNSHGRMDAGGRIWTEKRSLTSEDIEKHIKGTGHRIGCIPLVNGKCRWAMLDIDKDVSDRPTQEQVSQFINRAIHYKISVYPCSSKRNRFHLVCFFSDWIEASKIRQVLSFIRDEVELNTCDSGGGIYPKQDNAKTGNFIFLPFYNLNEENKCDVFLNWKDGFKPFPDQWSFLEKIEKTRPEVLDEIIEINKIEPEAQSSNNTSHTTEGNTTTDLPLVRNPIKAIYLKCKAVRDLRDKAINDKHLTHDERIYFANVFASLPNGSDEIHKVFSNLSDYDAETTSKQIASLLKKGTLCSTLCSSMCQNIIQRGGASPIAFAFRHKRERADAQWMEPLIELPEWDNKKETKDEPKAVHILDIEDARYVGKHVKAEAQIACVGPTYQVPYKFLFNCPCLKSLDGCQKYIEYRKKGYDAIREFTCEIRNANLNDEKFVIEIYDNDPRLLLLTKVPSDCVINFIVRNIIAKMDLCQQAWIMKETKYRSIRELYVVPFVSTIKTESSNAGQNTLVDEHGREYREEAIFFINDGEPIPHSNSPIEVIGWILPNPRNQTATMLVNKIRLLKDDLSKFIVTASLNQSFDIFRNSTPDGIAEQVTHNVTKIYGEHRERMTLALLLAYHSVVSFYFDSAHIHKGWIDLIIIGDTGQGKSQAFDNLHSYTGSGQKVDGCSASRTGIAYSLVQFGNMWAIRWGCYPLNDQSLLCIDEGQDITQEDWNNISSGRSKGVLQVDRVAKGSHPSRTRLIVLANPARGGIVDDQPFGCQMLRKLFTTKDIRRFDLAVILSTTDEDSGIVTKLSSEREQVDSTISNYLLRQSILWAWSRHPEQIEFTNEATKLVSVQAKSLIDEYSAASDVPLVCQDMKDKVARLSVACAALLHSSDDAGKKIIVREEHVEYIINFLRELYTHPNCGLDVHANYCRQESEFNGDEYERLNDIFLKDEDCVKIIKSFIRSPSQTRQLLSDILEVTGKTISNRMAPFREHSLILARNRGGYRSTAKFNRWVKRLIKDGKV